MADQKFHCIILKGGDQHPYFPRPLLSEFEFSVPLASAPSGGKKKQQNVDGAEGSEDEEEDDGAETQKLDQQFLLRSIRAAQVLDVLESSSTSKNVSRAQQQSLARLELEIDKTLLQMLAVECREGEERGMRALEMVSLMRDRSGRMIEAACKVAERYGRNILGDKIRELGEKLVRGEGDDDMDEDDEF